MDYFSNFFEVDQLSLTSSTQCAIMRRKSCPPHNKKKKNSGDNQTQNSLCPARLPGVMISDNWSQFDCEEAVRSPQLFYDDNLHIHHSITSLPAVGSVENAVKAAKHSCIKQLMTRRMCFWH